MTAPPDDTTTDLHALIAALRTERDAALSEKAALADALATRNSEFGEQIEQQTATIDVLKVMSASPGDPQPVFDLIVRRATELCNGVGTALIEFDGRLVHFRTFYEPPSYPHDQAAIAEYLAAFPMAPTRGLPSCRAILDKQIVHIRDVQADPEMSEFVRASNSDIRSHLTIPLMRDDQAVGAISLRGAEPGGFTDSQVELLKTFAEQAVIAITSAETYRALQTRTADLQERTADLQETLEYQTATSDVLKVISGSGFALEPVFQMVVDTAARLCRADQAIIFRLQDDAFRWAAGTDMLPEYDHRLRTAAITPGTGTL
jgi:hypothetical protein